MQVKKHQLYIDSLFNLDYYPIRASLVAQQVKNPPALQETPVQFPGQEDPLEKGKATHLQYSWASLVAQLVNNLPAMWETWVRSLDWQDPLEKGKESDTTEWLAQCCGALA